MNLSPEQLMLIYTYKTHDSAHAQRNFKRNLEILLMRNRGASFKQIGRLFDMCDTNVAGIVYRMERFVKWYIKTDTKNVEILEREKMQLAKALQKRIYACNVCADLGIVPWF